MYITFIQSACKSGSSIIVLYFVIVSLVTGCTTPLHDSLISIGGENKKLEYSSVVRIVCSALTKSTLPSTGYTACCEIMAVLRGDCTQTGGSFWTRRDRQIARSSSSSWVIGIGVGAEPFGFGAWKYTYNFSCGVLHEIFPMGVRSLSIRSLTFWISMSLWILFWDVFLTLLRLLPINMPLTFVISH